MKKLAPLSLALWLIGLPGCTSTYPPPSPLPAKGWGCTATDSDGTPYHYNDRDKATAARRALELCRDANYVPASCSIEGCEPLPAY